MNWRVASRVAVYPSRTFVVTPVACSTYGGPEVVEIMLAAAKAKDVDVVSTANEVWWGPAPCGSCECAAIFSPHFIVTLFFALLSTCAPPPVFWRNRWDSPHCMLPFALARPLRWCGWCLMRVAPHSALPSLDPFPWVRSLQELPRG